MKQNGIPFKTPVNKVITGTSDVADLVQVLPVFNDTHGSCDAAFYKTFIHNTGFADIVLGLCNLVHWNHDGNRTMHINIFCNRLIC